MKRGHRLGRNRTRLLVAIAVVASTSVLSVAPALAETLTPPPAEIPPTDTDFTRTVGVPQFDPALGTLISRTVTLTATVTGSMGVENTSTTSGSTGDMELSALVTVSRAADPSDTVTVASPAATETFDLTVFDGTPDFGGTSGMTFSGIDDAQTVTDTSTDPDILAGATGTGTLSYIVEAIGTSSANATGGNTSTFFASQAAATITVTYEYQPNVPAIDIEKATNGEDADTPTGPRIEVGDEPVTVTWTYVVTNTGNVGLTNVTVVDDQGVTVTCPQDTLAVAEAMTCTATGTAQVGQYANIGTATGTVPDGSTVTDSDPSHYLGFEGSVQPIAIEIVKSPDRQGVIEGGTATWTITVTNPEGSVDLINVTVTDAMAPNCDRVIGDLAIGESVSYTCSLSNVTENFTNVAEVTGEDGSGGSASDSDDAIVEIELPPTGASSSRELVIFGIVLLGVGAFLVAPRPKRRRG